MNEQINVNEQKCMFFSLFLNKNGAMRTGSFHAPETDHNKNGAMLTGPNEQKD